jgi:lipopolysaccharide transport system permease protein
LADTAVENTTLIQPGVTRLNPRQFSAVVRHLVKRELDATHKLTVLGWAWPILRQGLQLVILVFIFGYVIDLGIPHFPVYVFSGLLSWTWFSTGVGGAATCLLDERHLLFQPRFPGGVIPMVAITVPLVDMLVALPLLLIMAGFELGLRWTILLIPFLIVLQFVLMAGIAWFVATATVFFRDVPNIVAVALQALFYMTPVFYRLHSIPTKYTRILDLNPMTSIVQGYRALLLGSHAEHMPDLRRWLYVVVFAAVGCAIGWLFFRRKQSLLVDSL